MFMQIRTKLFLYICAFMIWTVGHRVLASSQPIWHFKLGPWPCGSTATVCWSAFPPRASEVAWRRKARAASHCGPPPSCWISPVQWRNGPFSRPQYCTSFVRRKCGPLSLCHCLGVTRAATGAYQQSGIELLPSFQPKQSMITVKFHSNPWFNQRPRHGAEPSLSRNFGALPW